MKLLILGGTKFLGRHLVTAALDRKHDVTIFNRGKGNPDLFPEIETLLGDRDGNLESLRGRKWDAVIDTAGYVPRIVNDSVRLLKEQVKHYTFISTISVYRDFLSEDIDEQYPVSSLPDKDIEEITGATYGPLKAECENVVESILPTNSLIIRPGLIVGPYDPTDRFTYWAMRFFEGGEIVVPKSDDQPVQWIDVRDLARWTIEMVEKKETGTFNAVGPETLTTFGELVRTGVACSTKEAQLYEVDEEFLLKNEVGPWVDIPLWLPDIPGEASMKGMLTISNKKAISRGLTYRNLEETIHDTQQWKLECEKSPYKAGITKEKEQEIIKKWKLQ